MKPQSQYICIVEGNLRPVPQEVGDGARRADSEGPAVSVR